MNKTSMDSIHKKQNWPKAPKNTPVVKDSVDDQIIDLA